MTEHVRIEQTDRILEIELCRPEKRNAITTAMYDAMNDALDAAGRDAGIRVVLLGGGSTFTAGNDLSDFLAHPPADENAPVLRFLRTISTFEKPIVAAVAGQATGIGTTMLLHCDVILAGSSARFHTPFVDLGLVPEAGSSLLLPLLIGHARAVRMMILGEPLDADEAAELGLVTRVVREPEIRGEARACAKSIAAKPPAAVQATKRLLRAGLARMLRDQMTNEVEIFRERLGSAEAREAFTAFLQKRPPVFD